MVKGDMAWWDSLPFGMQAFFVSVLSFLVGFLFASAFQRARRQASLTQSVEKTARLEERFAAAVRENADLKARLLRGETKIEALQEEVAELQAREAEVTTRLEEERQQASEKLTEINRARDSFIHVFKALSADVLKQNSQSFLDLAQATFEKYQTAALGDLDRHQGSIRHLVEPVGESLQKFAAHVHEVEKSRGSAYAELRQQVNQLIESESRLRAETAGLVQVLSRPQVRGRWGELQLRRTVELAGMLSHCDFVEQVAISGAEGRLRPDLIVNLPGGAMVVVDAKTPLTAYIEAMEAQEESERVRKFAEHARHVAQHAQELGKKAYWEQFETAPDFVVLFLPGENFFSAALQADPSLLERSITSRVILATPTTLIALLRAVALGWRQEKMSEGAREACTLSAELYGRIQTLVEHFGAMGSQLGKAVASYNKTMATLQTRVMVTARRLGELGVVESSAMPPVLESLNIQPMPGSEAPPDPGSP